MNLLEQILETARLRLVPLAAEYVPEIYREFTLEITRWMYPCPPQKPEDSLAFVDMSRQAMAQGRELVLAILDRATGEYLGNCGIHDLPSQEPELGIWLKRSAQGRGLGPEAITALKDWAESHLDYQVLLYPVADANNPSRRIPESLGGWIHREYDEVGMGGNPYHVLEYHIAHPAQKQRSYRNWIWDLDGTLTDPAEGITNSVAHALERLGLEAPPRQELLGFIGPPLHLGFQEYLDCTEAEAQKAVELYREYYREKGIHENRVYPGIPAFLESLQAQGVRLLVATSKPQVFARQILDSFGLSPFFDGIYGSELDGRLTDKTELLAHLVETEGLEARNCLMVGDRKFDLQAARHLAMDAAAAGWGYGSPQELSTQWPRYSLGAVEELWGMV